MSKTEKVAIEEEIALREKLLAFKKKQQEFNRETWRRTGVFLGVGSIILLCAAAVAFGGWSILKASNEDVEKGYPQQCVNVNFKITSLDFNDAKSEAKAVSGEVSNSSPALVITDPQKTFLLQPESRSCPHSWSSNIMLTINGILVLAGLGVAMFLGSRLLGERE